MPLRSLARQANLKSTLGSLTLASNTLRDIASEFRAPFLDVIAGLTLCISGASEMMEDVHELLWAIINLHLTSETKARLPPAMLYNIGKFTETLQKIYAFMDAQREPRSFKQFFKANESAALMTDCRNGLQQALQVFGASPIWNYDVGGAGEYANTCP
ncbi:hypothetical protein B0H10DRAFT_1946343 [Mycena sp. CBHHK59/15]|nr:hypothetical protein B0H10DRAFT_1946343 [Mycena sp. CBHHK59/15]